MRICAVEIKDNQAIICLLEKDRGAFHIPDCRARSLVLDNHRDSQEVKDYQRKFAKLLEDYQVEKVVVKSRPVSGKFAGNGVSHKIEAILQLLGEVETTLMNAEQIKASLQREPLPIKFKETGLKPFQEHAFVTGYAFINNKMPSEPEEE